MTKYLITTVEMRVSFGSLSPTPYFNTSIIEFEKELTFEEWEEFIRKKYDMYEETVIAISKLGKTK